MRIYFKAIFLFVFSFAASAEPSPTIPASSSAPAIQVYTKQSVEAVDNLNKAAEVLANPAKVLMPDHAENRVSSADSANNNSLGLTDKRPLPRDPTQMSGNFRQELNRRSPAVGASPNAVNNPAVRSIPAIELAAKIMGKNKSVMLKINDKRIVQIVEGGKISLMDNQQLITLRVDKIAKTHVKIFVSPPDTVLILQ